MDKKQKIKLVFFTSKFPERSETFILSKIIGLIERGFLIHIICKEKGLYDSYRECDNATKIKKNIHVTKKSCSRRDVLFIFPWALVKCFCLAPKLCFLYLC